MKNFQDLYTLDDMKIAQEVSRTYDTGLSRIAIKAPDQVYRVHKKILKEASSGADVTIRTLKLAYAIQVWCKAALISQDNPGDNTLYYWWLHWVEDDTPFKHIEYSDFHRNITEEELNSRFWKILEDVANSRDIKVSEGYKFWSKYNEWHETKIKCDIIVNDPETGRHIQDVCTYPFSKEEKSFSWDEIKDFFIELTIPQLELTHPKEIQNYKESNKPLLDACDKLDITEIQKAIDKGAQINCFDKYGDTPFTHAIEALNLCCVDGNGLGIKDQETEDIQSEVSKCIQVLEYLISKGADVNLFGCYITDSPLEVAWQQRSKRLIKFLLDNGANPNSNCELLDCISEHRENGCRSSVMYSIDWLIGEDYGPVERDIEWMLRCAGARLYSWDYVPWDNEQIGKFVVRISPSPDNDKMFVDNSDWYIGTVAEISIEDKVGNITKVDISGVEGLRQWLADYQENKKNGDYDWISWKNRGKSIAYEIGKLLPDSVALFYLNDSDDVMYKSRWDDYYTLNHSDGYLRIK